MDSGSEFEHSHEIATEKRRIEPKQPEWELKLLVKGNPGASLRVTKRLAVRVPPKSLPTELFSTHLLELVCHDPLHQGATVRLNNLVEDGRHLRHLLPGSDEALSCLVCHAGSGDGIGCAAGDRGCCVCCYNNGGCLGCDEPVDVDSKVTGVKDGHRRTDEKQMVGERKHSHAISLY